MSGTHREKVLVHLAVDFVVISEPSFRPEVVNTLAKYFWVAMCNPGIDTHVCLRVHMPGQQEKEPD